MEQCDWLRGCDASPMEPYANNIVTFRVLLDGYEQAVERLDKASRPAAGRLAREGP